MNKLKEKKKKRKLEYNTFNTIIYLFKHIWLWDKPLIFYFLIYSITAGIIPFIGIFLPKMIIDELVGLKRINILVIIIASFCIGGLLLNLIKVYSQEVYWPRVIQIRMEFIHKIDKKAMTMDYQQLERVNTKDLIQRAWMALSGNDIGVEGILNQIFVLFGNIVAFGGYIAIISTLSPLILFFLILTVGITYKASLGEKKYSHQVDRQMAINERKLKYLDKKMVNHSLAKDIRLYDMAKWLTNKYITWCNEIYLKLKKIAIKRFKIDTLQGFLSFVRNGIVYLYLINRVLYNGMSIGNFTMYFASIQGFSGWMESVVSSILSIRQQNLYINDYRKFVDAKEPNNKDNRDSMKKDISDRVYKIKLENIFFKYPNSDNYTINNVCIHVKDGEKVAIVGANGAGKTTLIKILTGLYKPTKGKVVVNGIDSTNIDKNEYFKLFSVVFQDIKLYAFSLGENISLRKMDETDRQKAINCLKSAGLSDKLKNLENGIDTSLLKILDEEGIVLSGGEIQKVALARALYKDAPILVLDEPTAALDPIAEHELYEQFDRLTKGKTAIYISHRLASTRFCDKIILLDKGSIKEYGTHEQLMKINGTYAKMFHKQARYYNSDIKDHKEVLA